MFVPLTYGEIKPIPGVTTCKGFFIRPVGIGLDIGEVYVTASQNRETQMKYARLFAAAPDLLAALEAFETEIYERFADMGADIQEGGKMRIQAHAKLSNAIAALKKARGI